jgi:Na+/proline symporter
VAVVVVLLVRLPVSPDAALRLAGATGRLKVFDFSFNLHDTYTFWSGMIGGTFLMLSYFGTDQSQVMRYLSAKSEDEARSAHLISAYWKIPLQGLVLLVGVLVFVYYLFLAPPLYFNPADAKLVQRADPAAYHSLDARYHALFGAREAAARALAAAPDGADAALRGTLRASDSAVTQLHGEAMALAGKISGSPGKDVNYIIPHFVLNELPIGLTGLFIAAVIAAAMSAVAGELTALSTATVIDHYKRWMNPGADDARLLLVSRAATGGWGLVACIVATFAAGLGSLIEVVNRFGSIFYGSILGVFILAMLPRIRANAAFVALIAGMTAVGLVIVFAPEVSFLWHNVVGVVTVVVVGAVLSLSGER